MISCAERLGMPCAPPTRILQFNNIGKLHEVIHKNMSDCQVSFAIGSVRLSDSCKIAVATELRVYEATVFNKVAPCLLCAYIRCHFASQIVVVVVPKAKLIEVKPAVKQRFESWIPTSHLVVENTPIMNGKRTGIQAHFNNVMSKINLKLVS